MSGSLAAFLAFVALGSYVQAVAGFAMGMILLGGSGALGLYDLPVTTAVVSLLALVNIALALHGHYHRIHRRGARWMVLGQLPMIVVGVGILTLLDARAEALLRALLGGFIVGGCLAMMARPRPRARVASEPAFFAAGLGGGLLGGLFSASAPVLAWFTYRQPLAVAEIRATLLVAFAASTLVRTLVVGAGGGLTGEVWTITGVSVPLVLLATWLGRRLPPPLTELQMRRAAFVLLLALGGWILASAAAALAR